MTWPMPMRPEQRTGKGARVAFALEAGVCGFFVYFGLWTILCNVAVLSRGSFETLRSLGILPIVAAVLVTWYAVPEREEAPSPTPYRPFLPWQVSLAIAAGSVALSAWRGNSTLFWAIGSLLLIFTLLWATRVEPSALSPLPTPSVGATLMVIALAGTLAIVRAPVMTNNPDDAFYVNAVNSLLDHPEWPVLRLDGMHGHPGLPVLLPVYLAHSFEPFVAWVAWAMGWSSFGLYYFGLPSLMAGLTVLVHWLALNRLAGRGAIAGLAVVAVLLAFWHGRGIGLIPLHMGKGILATMCVPGLVYFTVRFVQNPTRRNLLLLALAEVASIGFSSTGLIIGPLVVGITLAGAWIGRQVGWRPVVVGLAPSVYAAVWLLIVLHLTRSYGDAWQGMQQRGMEHVIGRGWLPSLLLFSLLAAALLPGDSRRWRLRAGYVLVVVLVVWSPFMGPLLASRAGKPMAWRLYWSVPFSLLAGVAASALWASTRHRVLAAAAIIVFCLSAVAAAPHPLDAGFPFVMAAEAPAPERAVAAAAVAATPPGGLILATESVAQWIPTIRHAPRLIATRRMYLRILEAHFGEAEAGERRVLLDYASGASPSMPLSDVMKAITRRRVDTIVLPRGAADRDGSAAAFESLGFKRQDMSGYEIWHVTR